MLIQTSEIVFQQVEELIHRTACKQDHKLFIFVRMQVNIHLYTLFTLKMDIREGLIINLDFKNMNRSIFVHIMVIHCKKLMSKMIEKALMCQGIYLPKLSFYLD